MRRSTARFVLNQLVGELMPEFWSAVFTIGFGLALFLRGYAALSLGIYESPVTGWFGGATPIFGLTLVLAGLLSLEALEKGTRWLFMTASLAVMLSMLWVAVFYFVAEPLPWHAVWVYITHAIFQGLIFIRAQHRLVSVWQQGS